MKLRSLWCQDGSFFAWIHLHKSVLMYVVGIESRPGLICSHRGARAAGVPSTFSPNTHLLTPGKCFQPELGYRKAAQTSEQRQECPSPSKGSIWPFLYPQLNTQQFEGRKGASVRKRLGNDGREGRSWAEILAPARASSAANATILTQKMMTATSSLYNVNKSFSHRPVVIHRLLTYIFCVFSTHIAGKSKQINKCK